jgi:adenylate cyclase
MHPSLNLRLLEADVTAFAAELAAPLELGRQDAGEPPPYELLPATKGKPARLVIAPLAEGNVSRKHAMLEPLPGGRVRVDNRSRIPLPCQGGDPVPPGASADLVPPFMLVFGPRVVAVTPADSGNDRGLHRLDEQTFAPAGPGELSRKLRPLPELTGLQRDQLVGWLQTTVGVLQGAAGAADFPERAAEALVAIVGLDAGRVLLRRGADWQVLAAAGDTPDGWEPSSRVLDEVCRERRTLWQQPRAANTRDSLLGLVLVVAAPLLDAEGNAIGALYGERRDGGATATSGGGKVEATLVELLACGVSAGLARQKQQEAALTEKARFEQFFTPQLAEELRREPKLLEGREAEVTLLFADVRGFSRVSEKLGPAGTVKWVGDVMGELSDRVMAEGGVLVDYVGDEMFAMWGAPRPQPDQAERAVRAALAMRDAVGELDRRWREKLGEPTAVGVGLNTGVAQVGNTGSRHKFKYGPLGNAVNLASRVQGLTKYLKCRLLVTAATRRRLGAEFVARRVVTARVVNIEEPVTLYEVEAGGPCSRAEFFAASEAALDALEAGEFALAARRAGSLLEAHTDDGPLLLVLARAAHQLVAGGSFDPVWTPPGK